MTRSVFFFNRQANSYFARIWLPLKRVARRLSASIARSPFVNPKRYLKPTKKDPLTLGKIRKGEVSKEYVQEKLRPLLKDPIFPCLVVFDTVRSYYVSGITENLRALGVKRIVCLPTSPLINYNVLRETTFAHVYSEKFLREHDYEVFDALGFVDDHFLCFYDKLLPMLKLKPALTPKSRVLGSVRYTPEWISIRENFYPCRAIGETGGTTKITILMSALKSNVNEACFFSMLKLISSLQDVKIKIKGHTRFLFSRFPEDFPARANIAISNTESSSALIEWADIVLFWSTSIAIEGYVKNKNMVCLDYLVGNKNLFKKYDAGLVAHCHDDVILAVEGFKRNGYLHSYNNSGRLKFLREVVFANKSSSDVPRNYLDFMSENEYDQ